MPLMCAGQVRRRARAEREDAGVRRSVKRASSRLSNPVGDVAVVLDSADTRSSGCGRNAWPLAKAATASSTCPGR